MKYLLKNETGFEIELNGNQYSENAVIELNELPSKKEIIVFNDGDCEVFLSNGYKTNDGIIVLQIYIN